MDSPIEKVELTATHAIGIVEDWMRSRQLAHFKTEVVVVNKRKSEDQTVVTTGGCTIATINSKQLGVMIDDKMKQPQGICMQKSKLGNYGIVEGCQIVRK